MYDVTVNFFEVIQQNSYYSLPNTIRDTLLPWLKQYLDFPDDAYYKGEFILSLTLLETNDQRLFPPLYIVYSKSKDTLVSFITEKKCLKELFPNIENRLQLFDQLSIKMSKGFFKNGQYYFNDYGFHGNAYNLYQNS
jgi:hypothetical protein